MSDEKQMLVNSITSVLVYRFPWLRGSASATAALNQYFRMPATDTTLEAAMGAMLDALQVENAEVKRRFSSYIEHHGKPGPC